MFSPSFPATTTGNISNKINSNDNEQDDNLDAVSPEEVPYPSTGKTNIDNHEVEVPRNYFFKGFLRW